MTDETAVFDGAINIGVPKYTRVSMASYVDATPKEHLGLLIALAERKLRGGSRSMEEILKEAE